MITPLRRYILFLYAIEGILAPKLKLRGADTTSHPKKQGQAGRKLGHKNEDGSKDPNSIQTNKDKQEQPKKQKNEDGSRRLQQ